MFFEIIIVLILLAIAVELEAIHGTLIELNRKIPDDE
jgi:hypothetical protein